MGLGVTLTTAIMATSSCTIDVQSTFLLDPCLALRQNSTEVEILLTTQYSGVVSLPKNLTLLINFFCICGMGVTRLPANSWTRPWYLTHCTSSLKSHSWSQHLFQGLNYTFFYEGTLAAFDSGVKLIVMHRCIVRLKYSTGTTETGNSWFIAYTAAVG